MILSSLPFVLANSDPKQSHSFAEIGAIFALFFAAQAYGYTKGRRLNKTFTVEEAVLFGINHLTNLFRPFNTVAWPLTPAVCAVLVLVIPYLPSFDVESSNWIFSVTSSVTLMGLWSIYVQTQNRSNFLFSLRERISRIPGLFASIYFSWFFGVTLFLSLIDYPTLESNPVIVEILTHFLTGWVIYMAYLGSEFDGNLDRINQARLEIDPIKLK